MEKQTCRKIKKLQIGNVEKYKNQFLQFGQKTGIGTHFTNGTHGLAKKSTFFAGEGSVCVV